jgi:hypothetical protein
VKSSVKNTPFMQSLINKGKIVMTMQDDASSSVNGTRTDRKIDTPLTRSCSRTVLEQTRRDLIVMRAKHGATSPIGCRCSNIVELIQVPEVPKFQLERQMADLQRLLQAAQ